MASVLSHLNEREVRSAVAAMHRLAGDSGDLGRFVGGALAQLPGVVASDLTTLSLCDLKGGTRRVFGRQAEALSATERAAFDQHFREHPLVRFHGSHPGGPTQRITDCVGHRAFKDSPLFSDYYRRIGINFVMALPLWIDSGTVVSIVFNRSRSDFKDSERAVLDVLRPALAALYRGLQAREEAKAGFVLFERLAAGGGWRMARVTTAGRILDIDASALAVLRRFFPREAGGAGTRLPAPLVEWLVRSRNWGLDRLAAHPVDPFTLLRFGQELTVHFIADPVESERGYLLMKERRYGVHADDLAPLPLTAREREVLALVAAGKTNADIGTILGISPRTVHKHLEHVFAKLGVETRTAAAVAALAAAGDFPG